MSNSLAEVHPELVSEWSEKNKIKPTEVSIGSHGGHTFQELAKDAKAVYHVKRVVLVNTEIVDEYLENFRDEL